VNFTLSIHPGDIYKPVTLHNTKPAGGRAEGRQECGWCSAIAKMCADLSACWLTETWGGLQLPNANEPILQKRQQ
jgi:hypothetical protein